jgi:hypothetical protein
MIMHSKLPFFWPFPLTVSSGRFLFWPFPLTVSSSAGPRLQGAARAEPALHGPRKALEGGHPEHARGEGPAAQPWRGVETPHFCDDDSRFIAVLQPFHSY